MVAKRKISNEEFNFAYRDKLTRNFIDNTIRKLFGSNNLYELKTCGMIALWKCMMYHNYELQEFNSSLFNFIKWECNSYLRNNRPFKLISSNLLENKYIKNSDIKDTINFLPKNEQFLINKYYFHNMTFQEISLENNISRESVRIKLNLAIAKLRIIFGVFS